MPGKARNVSTENFECIKESLRRAAAILRDADVPFALAGGLAAWARGGPEVEHDADFVILPRDVPRVMAAFEAAGMRVEDPPEEWLHKAWDGDILIDIIHEMAGQTTGPIIERATECELLAIKMPIMTIEDVLITKLHSLNEHYLAFERPLAIARAIREQVDWEMVRRETKDSPFACAFMTLVDELGITAAS
jgi:hypothetical protein